MVRGTRTLTAVLLALLVSVVGVVLVPASAEAAALPTPSGLDADPALPLLSWDSVPGATGYDVAISRQSDFATTVWTESTVNTQVVPEVALPSGQLFWRVRARQDRIDGDWGSGELVVGVAERPRLLPVTLNADQMVSQPDHPPLLRWRGVPGAREYVVQVSTDPEFVDSDELEEHSTKSLAWLVEDSAYQLPGNSYHWRVRADLGNGVLSDWADPGSYQVAGLPLPTDPSPVDNAFGVPVQDVVLDWGPVVGAARYDVRISADENFSSGVTTVRTVATQWSPPITVVNEQYYWQVRPIDALGTQTPWEQVDVWEFRRSWPDQPDLQYPADGDVVRDPLFVQWSPVPLASEYRVEFSTRQDFPQTTATTRSCTTTMTTLVVDSAPAPNVCSLPAVGSETYYWRVQGIDDPRGVVTDLIRAEVRSFRYRPVRAEPEAPGDGERGVTVPTMRWTTAQGAETYEVSWTPVAGGTTQTAVTATTSFTPRTALRAGATYRWEVRAISATGRKSTGTSPELQHTFTMAETGPVSAAAPDPIDLDPPATQRFPTLEWGAVEGADHYRLRLRKDGESTYVLRSERFAYPAGELVSETDSVPGTYHWRAEAWRGTTFLGVGDEGQVTVERSAAVDEHRASLDGTSTDIPPDTDAVDQLTWCDMGLPDRCQDLDQTPVVRWDPVEGASAYRVEITLDQERTTPLSSPLGGEFWTSTPMWAYDRQLPDSQAGSAYFVSVRACKTMNVLTCEPESHAERAFNKLGTKVQTFPAEESGETTVDDDVTFAWREFLDTNRDTRLDRDSTRVPATLGARSYEIQVSRDRTFTSTASSVRIVDAVVDQTTFTAASTTLPEGFSYWRVRAVDGSGNDLPWSEVRQVEKRSPAPRPTTPAQGSEVAGGESFRWEALPFAASYNVEVQRNGLVVRRSTGTEQTALTLAEPLPAGGGYRWRVQRVDASGREGEWSEPVDFTVSGATPELVAPASGEDVAPSGALFTWEPSVTAARYRFQWRAEDSTTAPRSVETRAAAYAPVTALSAGRLEWRVVALDSGDQELGASTWRDVSVQARPTASPPTITGTGRLGTTLTATEPDWSLPQVVTTVQWYRGTTPIPGATDLDHSATAEDVGKVLKARFTGSRPGWATGSVDSVGKQVTAGAAPRLLSDLAVGGPGRVGTELTLDPVTWDMPDVTTTFQWYRDGTAVRGETASTYFLEADDVGDTLLVRVTGRRTGYEDTVVEGPPVTATAGDAPSAVIPPDVKGSMVVGQTLAATDGAWSTDDLDFDHQWLRDGQPIPRANSGTYRLTADDAGRGISVRVLADRAGYAQGSATSAARTVGKLASSTVTSLSTSRVRRGRPVTVEVEVDATGVSPAGSVTLLADGRKVGTRRLGSRGEAVLRYVPRATGRDKLVVKYAGSTQVRPSASRPVTITVTR